MSETSRRKKRAARIERRPVAWPRHAIWVTMAVCTAVGVAAYFVVHDAAPDLFQGEQRGPRTIDAGTALVTLIVVAAITPFFLFWWRKAVRERAAAARRAGRGER